MFERPEFAVRGARPYDQDWIDGNVEAGVGACGWKRPKPRTLSMDGARKMARVKKPNIIQRVKARVAAPIDSAPNVDMAPRNEQRQIESAPATVDPLDDLLGPN